MKIMISGGYAEDEADTEHGRLLVAFARKLAEQIVVRHELLCGNVSSLDAVVIDAACDAAKNHDLQEEDVVISYVPKNQTARIARGQVNDSSNDDWSSLSGRKPNVPEPIDQADALILLGGVGDATGTYTAANWARQTGTPILPVATFGMAARDIYEDLPDSPVRRKLTGLADPDLRALTKTRSVLTDEATIEEYSKQVVSLAEKAALSRDVFVIMSFSEGEDLRDYLAAVKYVCKKAGFEAVRTDTRPAANAHQIVDAIHDNIENCGFVIADLTNERPNVYYEVGFARGLQKKLILTSKAEESQVHFDLQGFNRIEWRGSEHLKEQLQPVVNEFAKLFGLASHH